MTRYDNTEITYDLIGRMDLKEALLRKYIGQDFPPFFQKILVYINEKGQIDDQYKKIPIVRGTGTTEKIREYKANGTVLTEEQIISIENVIRSHHKEQKTVAPVNCAEIIDDYAVLMARIEEASEKAALASQSEVTEPKGAKKVEKRKRFERINWKVVGGLTKRLAVQVAPPLALMLLARNKV